MAKQRKGSGRVTPKGTKPPDKSARKPDTPAPDAEPVVHQRDLPGKLKHDGGHGARPISHNRGNR